MIGTRYWSAGITVISGYSGEGAYGWGAKVEYCDDGFADDDADSLRISTEGEVRTRYYIRKGDDTDALTVAVDTVKADAERLGVVWQANSHVHYKGDGEDENHPAPEGWRDLVDAQSRRIGWNALYGGKVGAPGCR